MFLHMGREINDAVLLYGFLSNKLHDGGSVPNASAPIVSIMRFTHNIMTALSGGLNPHTAPTNTMVKATMFTVSWN
jgi:hypothetical protein